MGIGVLGYTFLPSCSTLHTRQDKHMITPPRGVVTHQAFLASQVDGRCAPHLASLHPYKTPFVLTVICLIEAPGAIARTRWSIRWDFMWTLRQKMINRSIIKENRPISVPQDSIGSPKLWGAPLLGGAPIIGRIRYTSLPSACPKCTPNQSGHKGSK